MVVDEVSMVSQEMLFMVDQRLRQFKPQKQTVSFGGVSVILMGDFAQLPPVGQTALFRASGKSPNAASGKLIFDEFVGNVITLDECIRQRGDLAYASMLLRLRDGRSTVEDCMAFRTRCIPIPLDFGDCVHLYVSNEKVHMHNLEAFNNLIAPKCVVTAVNNPASAAKATDEEAMGLLNNLALAEGACVMLTHNICVNAGLVNGTRGIVKKVCLSHNFLFI